MDELMRTDRAAEYLQLCTETVRNMIRRKQLPAVRVGRQWRIRRSALDAYLDRTAV